MNTIKATVHTELITSDDGKHVFEVIKRLDNVDGENGYLISLYPARDKTNILDKHFFYLSGIRLFYSNRNNDPMAFDKAVFCCQNQIAISNEAKREFLKEYNEDSLPSHTGYKQLAIIYEKEKHFTDALKITEQALAEGWNTEDCISRIEKLKKKL